jgi:hypothetical protein
MAAMQVTLENIAPSKLLNYVQKQTLVDFVSPKKYAEVEHRLRQQLDKSKITLKDMKQNLATSPQFIQSLRNHPTGVKCAQQISAGCRETAWNVSWQSGGSQKGHDPADAEIQGLSSITITARRLRALPGQLRRRTVPEHRSGADSAEAAGLRQRRHCHSEAFLKRS